MHAGIFWGFVLLTIGTANIVLGRADPGGRSRSRSTGALWTAVTAMQNAVALVVLAAVGYAIWRRVVERPARLTLNRHALLILGLIGAVVAARAARADLRGRGVRTRERRVHRPTRSAGRSPTSTVP